MYLWIKAFHIITIITWFAGLFYLPRLFVYHAMAAEPATVDTVGIERFKIMERKLYFGIMTPSVVITVALGVSLIAMQGLQWLSASGWLHVKLLLVVILIFYHIYLGVLLKQFKLDQNRHGHVFYRWLNELPVLALVAVVCLAVVKPSF